VYGYPLEEAAEVAIDACRRFHGEVRDVRFALFGQPTWHIWVDAAARLLAPGAPG
jgi:O-acetyl-ADP-ribose deacetylase (regulator of RNase III)